MKIEAIEFFQDGNILARPVDVGQVVEVSPREYELIVSSGGLFKVVPDDTEVTLFAWERPTFAAPLTKEELAAKHKAEQEALDARQLFETQQNEARSNVVEPEPVMNLTATEDAQATKASEAARAKKLAEIQAKANAEAAAKVEAEVAKETKAEPKAASTQRATFSGTQAEHKTAAEKKAEEKAWNK
jgi:hypothetical protein